MGITFYNAVIDGKHSATTKALINRGSVFRKVLCTGHVYWAFTQNHFTQPSVQKTFSVKKYSENGAHGLALMMQDRVFALPYMLLVE